MRWRAFWLAGVGLTGSQAGHLLVYRLRFGAHAAALQGTGAHAYFPALSTVAFALAGTALLAALGVIGAARAIAGRRTGRSRSRLPVLQLAALLFTLQLALFALQETAESLAAGVPVPPIVLWYGVACQLPVALAGAFVLSLFLAQLEDAVACLREAAPRPWAAVHAVDRRAMGRARVARLAPRHPAAGVGSRGPPPSAR